MKRSEMAATSPTAKLELERENLAWLKEQCSESQRLTSGMESEVSPRPESFYLSSLGGDSGEL